MSHGRSRRRARAGATRILTALAVAAVLAGCASVRGGVGHLPVVAPAALSVEGDSHGAFDQEAKNALSDVLTFWRQTYPKLSGGQAFPELEGKLYSIDGEATLRSNSVPAYAQDEQCLQQQPDFIVDNAAYCELDDSVVWDRSPGHLLPVLADNYGSAVVALVFAHEIGHAIQQRLQTVGDTTPTIDAESQADCAAGAFTAWALAGHAAHVPMNTSVLSESLDGYLLIRDSTPQSPADISHGDGFDRLSAVQDGIEKGAAYCYSKDYFASRTFTERGLSDADRLSGGNQPLAQVLDPGNPSPDPNAGGLEYDLNRFWAGAGTSIKHTFTPVRFTQAAHPVCGSVDPASEFGYCPSDNTVYSSHSFAATAYSSITSLAADQNTADITLQRHQAGDYALGEVISVGWGMAAQHQFFGGSTTTNQALLTALCYSGAYAANINIANPTTANPFVLSAPDMDEATSAVLDLISDPRAFGPRDTSALDRVKAFVTGYAKGLHGC